jgi:hypothetical protein
MSHPAFWDSDATRWGDQVRHIEQLCLPESPPAPDSEPPREWPPNGVSIWMRRSFRTVAHVARRASWEGGILVGVRRGRRPFTQNVRQEAVARRRF